MTINIPDWIRYDCTVKPECLEKLTFRLINNPELVFHMLLVLEMIADEQNVYKGHGDYDIVPKLDADEAQRLTRRCLSNIEMTLRSPRHDQERKG